MANRSTGSPRGYEADDGGNLMTEQVKQGTQQTVQQTQQAAGQVAEQAKQQAQSAFQSQKDSATQTVTSVAQALRTTGQQLREQNQGAVGSLADRAAEQVERIGAYLQQRDLNTLVGDFEGYTRRSPAISIGGAFALGLLAARFLKSSSTSRSNYSYPAGTPGYTPRSSYGTNGSQSSYGGVRGAGTYSQQRVAQPYDDVGGAPEIRRQYAPGMTGGDAGSLADETTDMGVEGSSGVR